MKISTLPDDLNLDNPLSVEIYDYKSSKEISKQQVVLNKNTFSFLQEGTKEVFFDNSTYSIDNSQFLLMKSGHCLMTEKLSNELNNYRSILFFFSSELVMDFIKKFDFDDSSSQTLYSTYLFNFDTFIHRFVESIIDISKLSTNIQQKMLTIKFEEIMLYLMELKGPDFLYSLINNTDNESLLFTRTMESNILNKLTIKELSFLCNMSISKFKRTFEKHYQETPIKWFQDKRLEHAAFLLKNNQHRPSDIYVQIGYESLSNFITAFKIKFGVTPKQYQTE